MEKDSRNSEIEKQLLRLLARKIEKQLNKGPVSEWSQRDFVALSETIEGQTKEQISVTTLKRVFGKVEYHGLPYVHTLNVLAQFIGYSHWSEFKKTELGIEDEEIEIEKPISVSKDKTNQDQPLNNVNTKQNSKYLIFAFGTVLGLVIFFGIGWYSSWWWTKGRWLGPKTKNNMDSPGKLSAEILYPDSVPVQVKFNYQGPISDPDDLTVISFEPSKMEHFTINGAGYGHKNHTYKEPGIYLIRIFCNRRQLAYFPFLVPSKNWYGSVFKGTKSDKFLLEEPSKEGLRIPKLKIAQAAIDTNTRFNSSFSKFKDFGVSGDSFVFQTAIRNPQLKPEVKDQLSKILIRCANNSIQIQMAKTVPRHGFFMQVSDNYIDKLDVNTQKGFVFSLFDWRKVKIQTKNNFCKVWIDDKLVLEKSYSLPLGDVMGLEYIFVGQGEVKGFQFDDHRGKIWEETFVN